MADLNPVIELLDSLSEDTSVPRNVRESIAEAKRKLVESEDKIEGMSAAIYALDSVSNDINLPTHARTMVWNLLSDLEALKEEELAKKN